MKYAKGERSWSLEGGGWVNPQMLAGLAFSKTLSFCPPPGPSPGAEE